MPQRKSLPRCHQTLPNTLLANTYESHLFSQFPLEAYFCIMHCADLYRFPWTTTLSSFVTIPLEPVLTHFQSRVVLQNHIFSILNREIHSSFFDTALSNWQTLSAQKSQIDSYEIVTFQQEQPG
ncbi:hypothetical protein VP01_3914g1 [Puccinia sorghi]|uniref:Uncharacterized protein n=1 Tax=Puccinia sorghi TaxID=27349 RepID=A0A0L6USL4_9BASI|nr:hypothetical protein VP01_3914g1 [Puccinia sorghi]